VSIPLNHKPLEENIHQVFCSIHAGLSYTEMRRSNQTPEGNERNTLLSEAVILVARRELQSRR
jgi:hypothetical protein